VELGGPEQFSRSTLPVLKKYSSPEPCEKLETGHNKPAAKISILNRMVIPSRLLFEPAICRETPAQEQLRPNHPRPCLAARDALEGIEQLRLQSGAR
jgi:hypothetical protein